MALIQVFVATHNRPLIVTKTIQSILDQSFKDFEIILSDNSTNNQTKEIFANLKYSNIIYKKREPALSSNDHFNTILKEVTAEYFMIFHDDDIMYPDMIKELYNALILNVDTIAVGANAIKNISNKKTKKLFFTFSQKNFSVKNRNEVAHQYLLLDGGIVPFPSYLYKKEISLKLRFNPQNGGKYCDVAFIMDTASLGNVLFMAKPLMIYFLHKGQDSAMNVFLDKLKLINYITKTTKFNKSDPLIKKFRLQNIYCELKNGLLNGYISVFSSRYNKLLNLLLKSFHFKEVTKSLIISIWIILHISKHKVTL